MLFNLDACRSKAIWDWIILLLVIYTAIFTPYTAAFLLNNKVNAQSVVKVDGQSKHIVCF